MVIVTVGAIIFWTGWAAWSGAQLTIRSSASTRERYGGAALMLAGVAGFLFGMRLLVVTYLL